MRRIELNTAKAQALRFATRFEDIEIVDYDPGLRFRRLWRRNTESNEGRSRQAERIKNQI